jgi:NitT/TauT family transport system permease protein
MTNRLLPARSQNRTFRRALGQAAWLVAVYGACIAAWQVVVGALQIPKYVLPAPSDVVIALVKVFAQEGLAGDLRVTLVEMLIGLAIATVSAVVAAGLIEEFPLVRRLVYPGLVAFQSVPMMAVAPLIMIWVGLGIESKVTLAALVAFFPLLINSMAGFASYDRDALDLFRSLHAGRFEIFVRLKLRAFLPSFFAGLKVGYVFALLGAIVGEFLASTAGLGHAIIQMQFQLNVAGVFAVLVVLALMGFAGERVVTLAEWRWTRWRGRA